EALTRALGLMERDDLLALLLAELAVGSAEGQAAALSALAFRGIDPGRSLMKISADDAPALLLSAVRAARASKAEPLQKLAGELIASRDVGLRDEAILTGLVVGLPSAWATCRRLAASDEEVGPGVLGWVAMGGDARDQQALLERLAVPRLRKAAARALGIGGRVRGAEAC